MPAYNPQMKFTFGKYKGVAVAEVPTDYLIWVIRNLDSFSWKSIARDALLHRDAVKTPPPQPTPWNSVRVPLPNGRFEVVEVPPYSHEDCMVLAAMLPPESSYPDGEVDLSMPLEDVEERISPVWVGASHLQEMLEQGSFREALGNVDAISNAQAVMAFPHDIDVLMGKEVAPVRALAAEALQFGTVESSEPASHGNTLMVLRYLKAKLTFLYSPTHLSYPLTLVGFTRVDAQ